MLTLTLFMQQIYACTHVDLAGENSLKYIDLHECKFRELTCKFTQCAWRVPVQTFRLTHFDLVAAMDQQLRSNRFMQIDWSLQQYQ